MKPQIIQQGAEAIIYFKEVDCQGTLVPYIIKDRISKSYRHPQIDKKIIKSRTKSEAKLLNKANQLINAPQAEIKDSNKITMPFINGKKLSEHLEALDWKNICKQIGNNIAKLHNNNIIHGDLTTSNMILTEKSKTLKNTKDITPTSKNNKNISNTNLYFIDFGLGFISHRAEDKAVDLHLIRQALEAKHFSIYKDAWKIIIDNYKHPESKRVLEQLEKVELRGRYKGH